MVATVAILCAVLSFACVVLLGRAWQRSRVGLLFWSTVCFAGFFANNMMLAMGEVGVLPLDIAVWRKLPAVLGVAALIYGLVVESE